MHELTGALTASRSA